MAKAAACIHAWVRLAQWPAPKRTEGSDYECGITVDQIAAKELEDTPLRSIELTVDPGFLVGNCENG